MWDGWVAAHQLVCCGALWQQAELHVVTQVDYLQVMTNEQQTSATLSSEGV